MRDFIKVNVGFVYIGLCIILWSLIPVFAKLSQSGLDHHQYLFYSSLVSFLSLFLVSIYEKNIKEIFTYSKGILLVLFALGFLDFLFYLLLYYGYSKTNSLEVLVIQYTWPIFIVLLSLVILKESLTIKKLLSVIFGFIGVVLVLTKGEFSSLEFSNIDVLFVVLLAPFAFGLFSVLSKVVKVNATNAVMIYFFSAVIYSIITTASFSSFIVPSVQDWISILVNGVFINGISYLFWIKGLKIFDASKVAPYIFISPVLAAFFLILFFNEEVLTVYFIGLGFVLVSGLINSLK